MEICSKLGFFSECPLVRKNFRSKKKVAKTKVLKSWISEYCEPFDVVTIGFSSMPGIPCEYRRWSEDFESFTLF